MSSRRASHCSAAGELVPHFAEGHLSLRSDWVRSPGSQGVMPQAGMLFLSLIPVPDSDD